MYQLQRKYSMKKSIISLSTVALISLTSCGSESSDEAKELLSQTLTIIGIPPDIIVNICQDGNDDDLCDTGELSKITKVTGNFFRKIIENTYELQNYDPTKKILMELQSQEVLHNDGNFSLKYNGTSTELSILQSMVDGNELTQEDISSVKTMEGKDSFDEILLSSMMNNLNNYMNNDMEQRGAREVNLKELGRVLKEEIPLKELPTLIQEQCKEDIDCRKELIKNFSVNLKSDEQKVYEIAQARRAVKLKNDKLIEDFTCNAKEKKVVKHYGYEDIFNLKNKTETAHPTLDLVNLIGKKNLANYDTIKVGKKFAENVKNLPRNLTSGRFYIGLKQTGGKLDAKTNLHIGKYNPNNSNIHFNANLQDLKRLGWSSETINHPDPTTQILYSDFKNIKINENNSTLLDYLDRKNRFDVVVDGDTAVDFISVATCVEENPKLEIKQALNAFSCQENERLIKIIGGTVDAFEKGDEKKATPSETLLANIDRPIVGYDELSNNKFFLDTLNNPSKLNITNAQFSVGIKPLKRFLYQNDTIHLGSYEEGKYARFKLYGDDENSVLNQWKRGIQISNGERILQANLSDLNLTTGGQGSIFNMLKESKSMLDIVIQNDTSVDFSYLNLCIKK